MENVDLFVEFDQYCKTCQHRDLKDFKDPCNDCLAEAVHANSIKPVYYKADEKKIKEEEKKGN